MLVLLSINQFGHFFSAVGNVTACLLPLFCTLRWQKPEHDAPRGYDVIVFRCCHALGSLLRRRYMLNDMVVASDKHFAKTGSW